MVAKSDLFAVRLVLDVGAGREETRNDVVCDLVLDTLVLSLGVDDGLCGVAMKSGSPRSSSSSLTSSAATHVQAHGEISSSSSSSSSYSASESSATAKWPRAGGRNFGRACHPLRPTLWLHVYLFGGHVNRVPDSECCFCECPFFPVTFSFLRFRNRDQQYREPEYIFRFPISSSLYYEAQIMTNCSVPECVWINCMICF